MNYIFQGQNILAFIDKFSDDDICRKFIAEEKWKNGYECTHCKNTKFCLVDKHYARECTKCRYVESATAGTLFHKVKFGLRKAFVVVFEMSCTTKGLSSKQMAAHIGVRQTTAWLFMQKVKLAMESSGNYPLEGIVFVDEFVIGGKETGKQGRSYDTKKTKVVCAVEVSDTGKIKRGYAKVIDDYSANSIESIFSEHIGTTAQIKTDEWSAYKKLSKTYSIEQEKSMAGMNFKEIHTIIRNLKTWLRTIQTHIDKGHTQKYLDEFFYRLNRSIHKETIFR